MGYYLADVKAAREKIAAACPNVRFETWDYGYRLIGWRIDAENHKPISGTHRIILQPERPPVPESDFDGQPEIIADVDALIKEWSK